MKIGIVDLDTSHPQNWIPIEREMGHEIVGVWDGGSVHPAGYAEDFAKEHKIPRVFDSLDAMVSEVDCAIIHSCDWDSHVSKAWPFVQADKAVLVDKPMAGNLRDLYQLREWAHGGARIAGGSSLRFCYEIVDWLAEPVADRGTPHTVFCGCGVDEFNYGVHAYSLLSGILGPGVQSVRCLAGGVQRKIQLSWADHKHVGLLAVGATEAWLPFYATVVTERTVKQLEIDPGNLYRALLEVTLPYLAGETPLPPAPIDDLIEPKLCALAACRSWREGNRTVQLDEIAEDDGYDGAAFAAAYREARYPK